MRRAGLLAVLLLLAPSAAVAQTPAERAKRVSELAWERQGQGDFEGALAAFREMLAISRAIGETMIVVMAASGSPNISLNPFDGATTVTKQDRKSVV